MKKNKKTYMTNVELLRELVEDRTVAVLVFLDNRGNEGDQLVPELKVVLPGPGLFQLSISASAASFGILFGFVGG